MVKITINNRKKQNLALRIQPQDKQKGLTFIAHGLGGFKEQRHIETFANTFKEAGYTVVRWDAANTIGESDGNMEEASITSYLEDMEDVIKWSKEQAWYEEPFVLCGHSLGGIITILYSEKYPEKVKGLAPISTVVSGKLTLENTPKKKLKEWKKEGIMYEESVSKPGVIKSLKWAFIEDILKYDVIEEVNKITMPVLLIVGERDKSTPVEHNKLFYNAVPSNKKELHIIKSAPHSFRRLEQLQEIKDIFLKWIASIDN